MPLSDTIQHLDARIRATVEKTMADLRQELLERLQSHNQQLRDQLEALTPELPGELLAAGDLDSVLQEVIEEQEGRVYAKLFQGLKSSLGRLDTATSQSEILGTLLKEAGHHASRTAFFLANPGGLRGWGGHGFGDAESSLQGFEMAAVEGSSVARLLAGRGGVWMDSTDRARLSSSLEIPVPRQAVLVPLVLRDRIAAALYADRLDDGELSTDALQVLVHVASLALETLPLRERSSTPTLRLAEEAGEEGFGLPVWGATTPTAATGVSGEIAEKAFEKVGEEEAPEAPPRVAEEELEEEELDLEDMGPLDFVSEEREGEVEEIELETGPVEQTVEEPEAPPEISQPSTTEDVAWELEPAAEMEVSRQPIEALEPEEGETLPPPPAPAASQEDFRPRIDAPGSPQLEPRPPAGSQVAPPSDLEGPGWAFTSDEDRDSSEEAEHKRALRLAQILVSEIKLYNEEQIQEGRRNNDICERLKEDIERSRQLYEARVDERVLESTDYFYQEMVRVLGAGDPKALGI